MKTKGIFEKTKKTNRVPLLAMEKPGVICQSAPRWRKLELTNS